MYIIKAIPIFIIAMMVKEWQLFMYAIYVAIRIKV